MTTFLLLQKKKKKKECPLTRGLGFGSSSAVGGCGCSGVGRYNSGHGLHGGGDGCATTYTKQRFT